MVVALGSMCLAVLVIAFLIAHSSGSSTPANPADAADGAAVTVDMKKMPSWAKLQDRNADEYATNKQIVSRMNQAGKQFDFVLYGDSITAFHTRSRTVWNRYFGGLISAPLGVGGNTVEELAWRIIGGAELPSPAPKCVAVWVGINNVNSSGFNMADHMQRLEYLLTWMRAALPTTRLVLMALLPTSKYPGAEELVPRVNAKYRELALKLSLVFANCGQELNPRDSAMMGDGLHPTAAGHEVVLRCLKPIVDPLVR